MAVPGSGSGHCRRCTLCGNFEDKVDPTRGCSNHPYGGPWPQPHNLIEVDEHGFAILDTTDVDEGWPRDCDDLLDRWNDPPAPVRAPKPFWARLRRRPR